ncbi:hypothetical protein AKJ51_00310 [candidate division MSBL1 archaeon SCGC-AAA382A20]|uniref:DNA primase/polymerase bifunctional N-terminal domain-containing protein n=1 Tax=candidate division MSBL1 archaeon SCGC-AAA382A20 TaxID=1698280 RepID=A0A133VMS0_9EURY|nr:hypothetical protein AKJ51_00310 [candidate division MSBL1 archaeon SCGC-AAA382A20]
MKLRFLEDHTLGKDKKIPEGEVRELKNEEATKMLMNEGIAEPVEEDEEIRELKIEGTTEEIKIEPSDEEESKSFLAFSVKLTDEIKEKLESVDDDFIVYEGSQAEHKIPHITVVGPRKTFDKDDWKEKVEEKIEKTPTKFTITSFNSFWDSSKLGFKGELNGKVDVDTPHLVLFDCKKDKEGTKSAWGRYEPIFSKFEGTELKIKSVAVIEKDKGSIYEEEINQKEYGSIPWKKFVEKCIYLPVNPKSAEKPKGPNINESQDGPTSPRMGTYSSEAKDKLWTYKEKGDEDWHRWGYAGYNDPQLKLGLIDADIYKIKDEDEKQEVIDGINKLGTRLHETPSGGVHALCLFYEDDLVENERGLPTVPFSFRKFVDDKLNGYTLTLECDGYEVVDKNVPLKIIKPEDIPEELKKDEDFQIGEVELDLDGEGEKFENEYGWKLEDIRDQDEKLDVLLSKLHPTEEDHEDCSYPSKSEADLGTAQKLYFWEFDDATISKILKTYRKRDKVIKRADYVESTLRKAKSRIENSDKPRKISDNVNPETWKPHEKGEVEEDSELINSEHLSEELREDKCVGEGADRTDFSYQDIIPEENWKKLGDHKNRLQGPHPKHGSGTEREFVIWKDSQTWTCSRHSTSGNVWSFLAVMDGIIDCSEAKAGALTGEKWRKTIRAAYDRELITAGLAGNLDKWSREREAFEKTSSGGEKEVRESVSLRKKQVELAYTDLHKQGNATHGSIHAELNGNEYFEEDWKLSTQNLKQFTNHVTEIADLDDDAKEIIFKKFTDMKGKARKIAIQESAGLESEPEFEELDVSDDEIYNYLDNHPLVKLCEKTEKAHVEDSLFKILARFSAYSRTMTDYPVNLWAVGPSRIGKTHGFKSMLKTIPQEYKLKFSDCSPKAMYYFCNEHGEDALAERIVFFNEVKAHEEAVRLLRALTDPTEEKNRHLTVKDQENLELDIKGLPVTWFTSVNPVEDPQLKNRFMFCNPEESQSHKKRIVDFQKDSFKGGIIQPVKHVDFPVLKTAFRKVLEETKEKRVVIAFDWEWGDEVHLHQFFGSLMQISAKIHHRQRPQTDDTIIATVDDFHIAKLLFSGVARETKGQLKKEDLDLYELLPESRERKISRSEASEKTKIAYGSTRHGLERLVEADLANKTKESNKWYYWKSGKEVAALAVSLVQDSLDFDSIKETLEDKGVGCTNIEFSGGVGDLEEAITTHTPPYIRKIVQVLKVPQEKVKTLFGDCPSCRDNIASSATSKDENKEEKKINKTQEKVGETEKLGTLNPAQRDKANILRDTLESFEEDKVSEKALITAAAGEAINEKFVKEWLVREDQRGNLTYDKSEGEVIRK